MHPFFRKSRALTAVTRGLLVGMCGFGAMLGGSTCAAAEPLRVVTTLASYADIAQAIGGEHVTTTAIASPRFNPHFIEPRPSDVLRLKRADLFIHSGLDLEAWRDPLVNAAGKPALRPGGERELDLSHNITLLEIPNATVTRAHGDIHLHGNPHYWLSPENGLTIAHAIGAKLALLDPANGEAYRRGTESFTEKLTAAIADWRKLIAPYRGRAIVAYHNEWVYLTDFLKLTSERFLEPKPGIPPSPQHIETIVAYVREAEVTALVQATFHPTDAAEAVATKSGAKVVRICQNVGELPEASSYIAMLDFNIHSIVAALRR